MIFFHSSSSFSSSSSPVLLLQLLLPQLYCPGMLEAIGKAKYYQHYYKRGLQPVCSHLRVRVHACMHALHWTKRCSSLQQPIASWSSTVHHSNVKKLRFCCLVARQQYQLALQVWTCSKMRFSSSQIQERTCLKARASCIAYLVQYEYQLSFR